MLSKKMTRFFRILLIAAFVVPCLSAAAFAATYYVDSVSGNDSNSGNTSSSPWKTIAKVNKSSFQPGDSILFAAGRSWQEQLNPPSNGAAGKPITFGAYGTGDKPTIDGNNSIQYNINWNKSYITIDGLHLTRAANCNISQWSGEADYGIVQNCLLEYSIGMGIYAGQSASLTAKNWIVRNNVFQNGVNGSPAKHDIYIKWASGWLIENNRFTDKKASAVNLNGSSDCIVRYNYSSGHVAQFVQFYQDTAGGSKNNQIYYNVVNGDNQLIYAGGGSGHSGNVVYNNTQYGGKIGIYIEGGGTFAAVKNNIFWGLSGTVLNNTSSMGSVSNNNLNSYNPLFVNAGTDFHLTASSPCRNAGTKVSLTRDMDGKDISSLTSPDIGAYQYSATATATLSPPTNLRLL
ncbi:MAG: hypothetical protein EHM79_03885 [Geobacter sp.]|nr:MAG: hypothetical protein EHM79_03885 [Geobacter sp.]